MRKESLDFLIKLLQTPSPCGFEERIQKVARRYAEPYVDEIYKDVHGNQFHVKNADAKLRVMLAGHVDEISLMVHYFDDRGFLSFRPIGGVDASVLDGQRVFIHTAKGPVQGVIGRRAIHLMTQEERGKALPMEQMWIDIGATSKKEAQGVVAMGDAVTVDAGYAELRNDRISARALDDRVGAFVVLETMRLLARRKINVGVYCVTTVQEEIGLRGAITSAYGVNPHVGVAVDVSHATDHPDCDNKKHGEFKLDAGPIIDRGPNINPVLFTQLTATAKRHKIPYQVEAEPRGTGTDANAMQLSRGGCATAIIGVPNRYMHSPVEVVSLKDVERCAQLLAEWICGLKPNMSFIP